MVFPMNRTNHKWMILSAVMHAALLLGLGSMLGPVLEAPRVSLVLNLVPSLSGKLPGSAEEVPDIGSVPIGKPVTAKEEKTPSRDPVQTATGDQKKAPRSQEKVAAGEKISQKAQVEDLQVPAPGVRPAEPVESAGEGSRPFPGGLAEKALQDNQAQSAAGVSSHRPPSPFPPSRDLLAYAGEPSFLGAIPGRGAGSGDPRPEIVSLPEPVYPVRSRRAGEEGRVVIEVRVGPDGRILGADVMESSSHPRLDRAALKAVKTAVFRPAAGDGMSVRSRIAVAYRFRLEEK